MFRVAKLLSKTSIARLRLLLMSLVKRRQRRRVLPVADGGEHTDSSKAWVCSFAFVFFALTATSEINSSASRRQNNGFAVGLIIRRY